MAPIDLWREACLIDGAWVTGTEWIEVDDPATGAIIGRVPALGVEAAQSAIAAAARAMIDWAALPACDRAQVLYRFFDLVMAHREPLAALLTLEQGKPLAEALGEIAYAASYLKWYAEEARRTYGETIPAAAERRRLLVLKQPVGVVAAITPWNFPAAMVARKIAPALAAGCGVVVKPAAQTPFTALALGALSQEAGLPDGLLNIVTGDAETIGSVLTASPVVRKLSFTGSTAVGARLYAQCAPTIKKLGLELGGNAPFVVFEDADIESAVEGAIQAKFRNAGQTCVCVNRFYVQRAVQAAFTERFVAEVQRLKVGSGNEVGTTVGPLIDEAALAKIEEHIADGVAKGARIQTGGSRDARGGRFFQPTVMVDVRKSMLVMSEETFGPLAAITVFDDESDVVRSANDTEFGLAAYFYTRDLARMWRMAEALETGMVGVNTGLISTEVAPFGGVKASGLGREGSRHGLDDYLELKYVCIGI